MKPKGILKSEKGQAMVEFAMILPLYLFMIFFIINIGWVIFQVVSFDYAYREAAYEMAASDQTGSVANASIKNAIIDKAPWLEESDLLVSNAEIIISENDEVPFYTPARIDGELYTLKQLQTWVYADITADISYEIKLLVPFDIMDDNITVTKSLSKKRVERITDNTDT